MVAGGADSSPVVYDDGCVKSPAWTELEIGSIPQPKEVNMTRNRSITLLAGAAALAVFAAAGCGGDDSDNASASASPAATTMNGTADTVDVANTDLGTILVDAQGRTLYLFAKDSGTTSACTGACATAWPPIRDSGQPTVGSGADASLVGTTQRSDGDPQVTYNGHPLYLFQGDQKAGDTNGEGLTAFGGGWFALSAAGDQVAASSSGSGASTSTGSGY
jgi:predicted lipoprotein with Yx(FWY)xxD motif